MTATDFENDEVMLVHDEDELPSGEDYSSHMPPIPVRLEGQDSTAPHQGIHFTVSVNTSDNPVQQLLPRDYDRYEVVILAIDEPVVIAQSREIASNANNTASSVPNPSGFYLPISLPLIMRNCDEVWLAATSATAGRVSVLVSRRLAVSNAPDTHA